MGQGPVDIVRRKIIKNNELQHCINNVVAIAIRCWDNYHTSFKTVVVCLLFSDLNSDGLPFPALPSTAQMEFQSTPLIHVATCFMETLTN